MLKLEGSRRERYKVLAYKGNRVYRGDRKLFLIVDSLIDDF
jgi:hypothetical protein